MEKKIIFLRRAGKNGLFKIYSMGHINYNINNIIESCNMKLEGGFYY